LTTGSREGTITKYVTVYTNDPSNKRVKLTIKATIGKKPDA
jgi:hypothetical protein